LDAQLLGFEPALQARYQADMVAEALASFPAGSQAGARALDLGCGPYYPSALLLTAAGLRVDAVDPRLGCGGRRRARGRLRRLGRGYARQRYHWRLNEEAARAASGVRLLAADGAALPFADATFDLVYSCAVFEHLPDVGAVAREAARVLRPGGTMWLVIHHWPSLTGAHHPVHARRFPRFDGAIPPWEHLTDGRSRPPVFLNRLRRPDYLSILEATPGLQVRGWHWRDPHGRELLTPALRERLAADGFGPDELTHTNLVVRCRRAERPSGGSRAA
jgi:SAM-dependent methyltransferase